MIRRCLCALALATGVAAVASAQDAAKPTIGDDASVHLGTTTVPYSGFASPQARAFFPKMLANRQGAAHHRAD